MRRRDEEECNVNQACNSFNAHTVMYNTHDVTYAGLICLTLVPVMFLACIHYMYTLHVACMFYAVRYMFLACTLHVACKFYACFMHASIYSYTCI